MANFHVYILASKKNGTLYIGFTNNLKRRLSEHRRNHGSKFVAKYEALNLVYFEPAIDLKEANLRETRLKTWKREWKLRLIESMNPNWENLAPPSV